MEDLAQEMKTPIELFIESKVLPEYRISNVDDFQEEIFRYYIRQAIALDSLRK
jgi:hypothetical protein